VGEAATREKRRLTGASKSELPMAGVIGRRTLLRRAVEHLQVSLDPLSALAISPISVVNSANYNLEDAAWSRFVLFVFRAWEFHRTGGGRSLHRPPR